MSQAENTELSVYYKNGKSVPFSSWLSMYMRKKMFSRFMSIFSPTEADTVLDVGVTSDTTQQQSNYFEQLYPYPHRITCVGTEDGSHLPGLYQGLRYYRVEPGKRRLPFNDGEYSIVFSNAVLEHVGSRDVQAHFLSELARVSRRGFFVTTPHRFFPFEHHTGLPLLHYLPSRVFRMLIRKTRYGYWADEANLNILTPRSLRKILPQRIGCRVESVRFFAIPSNILAFASINSQGKAE